ncbi:hypothetical protein AVEN_9958-1 [Araneus ventricosus]|uniref:Uncharacterized protein n=1 Tax=Araneus ventricosus TaxID=182803 RepID=A0A4Y2F829_ARAVE|nr:hypothetical protein AVEN_9958-1 [Araneus ventricosus]
MECYGTKKQRKPPHQVKTASSMTDLPSRKQFPTLISFSHLLGNHPKKSQKDEQKALNFSAPSHFEHATEEYILVGIPILACFPPRYHSDASRCLSDRAMRSHGCDLKNPSVEDEYEAKKF